MQGLTELPDLTLIFDKPEGRIIESLAAIGAVSPQDVQLYYESTLPQFGWRRIADGAYIRLKERLSLSYEDVDGQSYIKVMVQPK